ncbi:cytochrome-c peroxidase [Galenea microaerophila]
MKLNHFKFLVNLISLVLILSLSGCQLTQKNEEIAIEQLPHYISDEALLIQAYQKAGVDRQSQTIIPIPDALPVDPQQSQLGKKLFFDPRLSTTNRIACVSCHIFAYGGTDNKPVSIGENGQKNMFNSLPVFNAVFNIAQFWDGRAEDLAQQAEGSLLNPVEMGNPNWPSLINKLKQLPDYQSAFQQVFPQQGMTKATITYAIAQYERTLLTPNSPFDRYLKGNEKAISKQAKQGYHLFQSYGCIACHNGINIGGNLFQKAGVFKPLGKADGALNRWDGRYAVTHNPMDKGFLKVPSLRNVVLTAPYFHDGSVPTLKKAIQLMAERQLGIQITDQAVSQIEAFLNTLTGQYQGRPLK